jgi:hypothetical protein
MKILKNIIYDFFYGYEKNTFTCPESKIKKRKGLKKVFNESMKRLLTVEYQLLK